MDTDKAFGSFLSENGVVLCGFCRDFAGFPGLEILEVRLFSATCHPSIVAAVGGANAEG
jgi:hypothetical protein